MPAIGQLAPNIFAMKFIRHLFLFMKRLLWALVLAYMVAWHNVYKEDDKILYHVVSSLEEDHADETTSPEDQELINLSREEEA